MVERFLAVAPVRGAVGAARRWACAQVQMFGWPTRWRPDTGAVGLVVSELVTNALRYAGGLVGLSLTFDARRLRITVSDDSPRLPVPRVTSPGAVGGWGLHIVDELAGDWGVSASATGKRVWADLTAPGVGPAPARAGMRAGTQTCLSCSSTTTWETAGVSTIGSRWWLQVRSAIQRARSRVPRQGTGRAGEYWGRWRLRT